MCWYSPYNVDLDHWEMGDALYNCNTLLYFFAANAWYDAIISFCTKGSTARWRRYSIVNSPLPCVIPRSCDASMENGSVRDHDGTESAIDLRRVMARKRVRLTSKHVVKRDLSRESELLISNLRVDNRSLALVDTTDDSTWTDSLAKATQIE